MTMSKNSIIVSCFKQKLHDFDKAMLPIGRLKWIFKTDNVFKNSGMYVVAGINRVEYHDRKIAEEYGLQLENVIPWSNDEIRVSFFVESKRVDI